MKKNDYNWDLIALVAFSIFFASAMLWGEVPAPIATPAVVTNPVGSFIDSLTAIVLSWKGLTGEIGIVLEFVLRLIPTKTPLSLAWVLSGLLHSVGKLLETVAEFLDKVLPQNTK